MSTASRNAVMLVTSSDWPIWLSNVRTFAIAGKIWDYVDPNISAESIPQLVEPPFPNSVEGIVFQRWKYELSKFKAKEENSTKLVAYILGSISSTCATQIRTKSAPYEMLVSLQKFIAPTPGSLIDEIETTLSRISKLYERTSMDEWLALFTQVVVKGEELQLATGVQFEDAKETSLKRRLIRHSQTLNPVFYNHFLYITASGDMPSETLLDMVKKYRDIATASGHVYQAHATLCSHRPDRDPEHRDKGHGNTEQGTRSGRRPNTCKLCESRYHQVGKCFYHPLNHDIRTPGFTVRDDIIRKTEEKMKDPEFKAEVDQIVASYRAKNTPLSSASTSTTASTPLSSASTSTTASTPSSF